MFIPSGMNEKTEIVRKAYDSEVQMMASLPHSDNLVGMLDK